MGRRAGYWKRTGRNGWYATIGGRQVYLGDSPADAEREFYRIKAGLSPAPRRAGGPKWKAVVPKFVAWLAVHRKPSTVKSASKILRFVAPVLDNRPVAGLTSQDVDAVFAAKPGWSPSTRRTVATWILACLSRCVRLGIIPSNPLDGKLELPSARSRGREAVIHPEDVVAVLGHAGPALRDVLNALRWTGCRPGELVGLTADHVDPAAGAWVLPVHKTDDDGSPRTIYLSPEAAALTARLVAVHPTGVLFRNSFGRPWTAAGMGSSLTVVKDRLRRKGVKLKGKVMLYGFRHTFATNLLAAKVPDAHVAALLGHKGTAILHRNYSHLTGAGNVLKAHLAALGGQA